MSSHTTWAPSWEAARQGVPLPTSQMRKQRPRKVEVPTPGHTTNDIICRVWLQVWGSSPGLPMTTWLWEDLSREGWRLQGELSQGIGKQQMESGKGQMIPGEGLPGPLPGCDSHLRTKTVVTSDPPPHSCCWMFMAPSPRPSFPQRAGSLLASASSYMSIKMNSRDWKLETHKLNSVPMYDLFSPCRVLKCGPIYRAGESTWVVDFFWQRGKSGHPGPQSLLDAPWDQISVIQVTTVPTIS